MGFRVSEINDKKLERLYRYWCDKRGARSMPARADIDPLELRELMGSLFLIDVKREPPRFRYRLAGGRIVEMVGNELTGRSIDEYKYGGARLPLREQCGDVVDNLRPAFMVMLVGRMGKRMICRHLVLPLSSNGQAVDMLLGGAIYVPAVDTRAARAFSSG
jgi:hypothetical protein